MELNALRYYVKACDLGSVTKAAEELYVSRQSVSHSLLRLEEGLGAKLLVRRRDGIEMTAAGAYVYRQAKQMLEIWGETEKALAVGVADYRKTLRVAFGRASYNFWAGKAIYALPGRFEQVEIQVETMAGDELYEAILRNEVDLIVSNSTFRSKNLTRKTLLRKPVVGVIRATDPLAAKPYLELSDLAGREVMLVQQNETFVQDLNRALISAGIECSIRYLHSMEIVSILKEIYSAQNFIHLTADFFSDALTDGPFVIRELRTKEQGLNKDIRAYCQNSSADDMVIGAYIDLLRGLTAEQEAL